MMKHCNQAGWTPLMNACEQGNLEVIKVIVENGGSQVIEFKSSSGSPLHAAISCQSTAIQ